MNLIENWSEQKAVLLEGLTTSQKKIVSPLMENQKNHLLETASAGSISAGDIAGFRKVLIPMIRRIIPGTIAGELVGVQPMAGPVGLVYSMRYKYVDAVAGSNTAGAELFGNATPISRFYSGGTDAAQAPGAGGFGAAYDITDAQSGATKAQPLKITGTPSGAGWGSSLDITSSTANISRGGSGNFIEGSGGRPITAEIVSQAVESSTRKLQSGWTLEAMQDAKSQHGIDLEEEMTKTLSAQIVQEIDNEIITDLLALAGTVDTFDGTLPSAAGYYKPTYVGDRFAGLGTKINYVANEIARKTRRGAGNFVVVSPMIVSLLQSASKAVFAPAVEGSFKGPNNTQLVGTLNGTIKVYSYLWNQSIATDAGGSGNDSILVGYKGGNGESDAGYFYCPYVPLMSSGVVTNPTTFQPAISLMTRYGKTTFTSTSTSLGNSADYYGKITVSGLTFS